MSASPDACGRIFLLSHMRAYTSLAGHILGVSIPADDDKAAEDEARLLYVAMTGATRELLVLESET